MFYLESFVCGIISCIQSRRERVSAFIWGVCTVLLALSFADWDLVIHSLCQNYIVNCDITSPLCSGSLSDTSCYNLRNLFCEYWLTSEMFFPSFFPNIWAPVRVDNVFCALPLNRQFRSSRLLRFGCSLAFLPSLIFAVGRPGVRRERVSVMWVRVAIHSRRWVEFILRNLLSRVIFLFFIVHFRSLVN